MAIRSRLLAGASVLAASTLWVGFAAAQSTQAPSTIVASQTGDADHSAATPVQEVVVTGSHIAKPDLDQPTPVATLSSQRIQDSGTADLGDILAQLPEVGSDFGVRANANNYGNTAGISAVDLHNLGVNRTLVLVNGQRHVAGDESTDAVDLNSIPAALVDRVEVITGGASAIYGSDAVSGVVNIILKKNFQGIDVGAQTGGFDDAFGQKSSAYGTFGHNFLDGKLNVAVSAFWNHENGIMASDLPYNHNYGTITNPKDLSGPLDPTFYSSPSAIIGDHIPDNLTVPNIGSEYLSRNGVLLDGNTFSPITTFTAGGQPVAISPRSGYNNFTFGQLNTCPAGQCYFPETYTQVSSPVDTHGFELNVNYDITPHLHASLDAKGVETVVFNAISPDYSFGAHPIQADNAFITPAIAALLAPYYASGDTPLYSGFVNDVRTQGINRQTYRVVGQLGGDFDVRIADVKWDSALNYGQTYSRFSSSGDTIAANFANALDSVVDPATGQAICRANLGAVTAPGCAPFNPFGTQQSAATDAYSFARLTYRDHLSQEVGNLNLNADTRRFFNLQGGPIGLAVGGEYRMERTYENNDPGILNGSTDFLQANSAGGYNVAEGYVEVNVPVFKNFLPLLQELSFDGAFRGAHYSSSGEVDAYKVSTVYAPVRWFKLRGTYSSAVRAPNITEAYSPDQSTYYSITDPCSAENINGNVNYAKNCAAAGIPQGFVANTSASIIGKTSGNPDLHPEKSLSYTVGGVFQPPVVPNLSVTMDYYSILIKDAITDIAAQDEINNCYNNSAGLDSQYCGLFTRGSNGNIDFVSTTFENAAKLYTNGVELQIAYSAPVAPLTQRWKYSQWLNGRLGLTLDADYVLRLRNFPFQNNPGQYNVWEGAITGSEGDVPQMKGLASITYNQGPMHLDWTTRYVGRAARFDRDPTQADFSESTDQPYAGAKFYHDLTVRYDLPGPLSGTQIYVGCDDIFGDTPPLGLVQGGNGDASYDLGRYLFAGVRIRH